MVHVVAAGVAMRGGDTAQDTTECAPAAPLWVTSDAIGHSDTLADRCQVLNAMCTLLSDKRSTRSSDSLREHQYGALKTMCKDEEAILAPDISSYNTARSGMQATLANASACLRSFAKLYSTPSH